MTRSFGHLRVHHPSHKLGTNSPIATRIVLQPLRELLLEGAVGTLDAAVALGVTRATSDQHTIAPKLLHTGDNFIKEVVGD